MVYLRRAATNVSLVAIRELTILYSYEDAVACCINNHIYTTFINERGKEHSAATLRHIREYMFNDKAVTVSYSALRTVIETYLKGV